MRMPRLVLLCCLLIAVPASAAELIVPLSLRHMPEGVDVLDANGRLLQTLPCQGEDPDADNEAFFSFVADMDFDGFPDVGVLNEKGMNNVFYDAWLWRPAEGRFEPFEDFSLLPNPRFLPADKRVLSCMHGCAVNHLKAEHIWEDGTLKMFLEVKQEYSEDGTDTLARVYERGADGEMRMTSETGLAEAAEPPGVHAGSVILDTINLFPVDLPEPAQLLDGATSPDGTWRLVYRLTDETVLLKALRMHPLSREDIAEDELRESLEELWPGAREVEIGRFAELEKDLDVPAARIEFLSGENEDTERVVAALLLADEWSFLFLLQASVDAGFTREDMNRVLLSTAEGVPDTMGLFDMPTDPVRSAAPSCGDDRLRIGFLNLARATLRDAAVRWKAADGGGRFAWIESDVDAEESFGFADDDGALVDGLYFDFDGMRLVFDNLGKLERRQKMILDIGVDANDIPRLTLQENDDYRRLVSGDYYNEWIDVKGELYREDD